MADHIFSRCGAVPGILDAIIVQGDASEASESLSKAKVRFSHGKGEIRPLRGVKKKRLPIYL